MADRKRAPVIRGQEMLSCVGPSWRITIGAIHVFFLEPSAGIAEWHCELEVLGVVVRKWQTLTGEAAVSVAEAWIADIERGLR